MLFKAVLLQVKGQPARRVTRHHILAATVFTATLMGISGYGGWLAYDWLLW